MLKVGDIFINRDEVNGIEYLWCAKDDCATDEDYYCGDGMKE